MYLTQNPVLQHELVANLRKPRAFLLLVAYIVILGGMVLLAWPKATRLDLTQPAEAQRLTSLLFLGQFVLASLMAPSFAAGALAGEKERLSLEMLLATPMRPGAIVLGKFLAALTHLGVLVFCSLPIVLLCVPLGGVSPYEVLAAYVATASAVALFGIVSLWASGFFERTSSALVVSYFLILPMALGAVAAWNALGRLGEARVLIALTIVPIACAAAGSLLWWRTCQRLLTPPDLGSGGADAIDLETEARDAVGLYIERNEFPDRLFAPPKRTDFLEDGANPIYDKEMRSEIFSQGTLVLRLVIQVSMLLAIPLMAACVYIWPWLTPWYVSYVLLFSLLCGPVFSAGSVCSERERQTLDLLLVTLITPAQMLWGKLLSGLRVSTVLTAFLAWPLVLACLMPLPFWTFWNLLAVTGYLLVVLLTCVTTSGTALLCSTLCSRTATSLVASYLTLALLFAAPLCGRYFAESFYPGTGAERVAIAATTLSPFAAVFAIPLDMTRTGDSADASADARQAKGMPLVFWGHVGWSLAYQAAVVALLGWRFRRRWRIAE
jgi:ABC-type transport system involved in multi-copper enzyme maturation permease subunit